MTAFKVLQDAPIGSRAVFDYGYGRKEVLHKITDDRWRYGWSDRYLPGVEVGSKTLADAHVGRTFVLRVHPPAPVRVHQWRVDGKGPWYFTRYCRVCGDFEIYEGDSDAAHADGRTHAKGHAQARVA